jgi:superfamily I DNA and/or RNA helicase
MFRNADLRDIKVGTVDDYQGQEGKVIFVSTTVSRRYGFADFRGDAAAVSFVGNPQRFNVALSRAQHMLVIVGDPWVLNMDRYVCILLVFVERAFECFADAGELYCASASATERTKVARCRHL